VRCQGIYISQFSSLPLIGQQNYTVLLSCQSQTNMTLHCLVSCDLHQQHHAVVVLSSEVNWWLLNYKWFIALFCWQDGYRNGVQAGEEASLQAGHDAGFHRTSCLFHLARIRGSLVYVCCRLLRQQLFLVKIKVFASLITGHDAQGCGRQLEYTYI